MRPFARLTALALLLAAHPANARQAADREPPSETMAMLLEHHAERPRDGVVLYTIAKQHDREGRPAEALTWLRRLETAEWDDMLEPDDFPAASQEPGYAAVAARIAERARVARQATVAHRLDLPDLQPEGTAWDPRRREVLLSSGHFRKVVAVDEQGRARDAVAEAQDGLMAVLGMEVDPHGRLWVASTAAPFMQGYTPEDAGRAAVFAFDLETGGTLGRWDAPEAPALLNDLTVAPDGRVYVTDSQSARVLRLDPDAGAWTPIGPAETFVGLNGLALSGDGGALFVADFVGLTRIDLTTGEAERLDAPPSTLSLGGIDGLRYHRGTLIAVQNVAGLGRVWRIGLDAAERRLTTAELLEAGNPAFRNPTTGAIGDGAFYFLGNPRIRPDDAEQRLQFLRIPLGPHAGLDQHAGRETLMQADRAFAEAVAEGGIDAWMRHMAPDAVRLLLGRAALSGHAAIREADAPLFDAEGPRLVWTPVDGGVFSDGRHGFTTGTYRLVERRTDGTEAAVGQGSYLTLWRRAADGAWEIILDGGAAGPPPGP